MGGYQLEKTAKTYGIKKVIAEFKEIVTQGNIEFDLENVPTKPVRRLLKLFSEIEDTRVEARTEYPLGELLLIAFIAILNNADTFVTIAQFCMVKIKLLRKFTPLENGVPSHDTFRRVFTLLDPKCLQEVTVSYLLDNIKLMRRAFGIDDNGLRHLCVDGKTANGSGRLSGTTREIPKIHTLHVYDTTNGICLVSKAVGEKTNEIPEAQAILKGMDLKGIVVSFDAMNTQRDTISIITEQKGLYLGSLKRNQPSFLQEVQTYFTAAKLSRIKASNNYLSYSGKAHNCIETRTYWLTKNVEWLLQINDWPNLKSLIRYEKKSIHTVTGKESKEVYYYISSLSNVHDCADVIRGHWGVENLLHWHLDTNFNEDGCSIVDRKAFQNISLMNKLALSLMKLVAPIIKVSIRSTRHIATWDSEGFLKILCAIDEGVIEKALRGVSHNAGKKGRLKIPEDV
jgi:predicted transposase YbfD/YdcC